MNKRYPNYGKPGFCYEYFFLREKPKTSEEVYRQLHALDELADHGKHRTNGFSPNWKPSKRRKRLVNTYWALFRRERAAQAAHRKEGAR